jgi:hypothetical protein
VVAGRVGAAVTAGGRLKAASAETACPAQRITVQALRDDQANDRTADQIRIRGQLITERRSRVVMRRYMLPPNKGCDERRRAGSQPGADLSRAGLARSAGSGHAHGMSVGSHPVHGRCAAVDVHYPRSGGARAAVVVAADAAFWRVLAERTAVVPEVGRYRPGEFYRRELPPLRPLWTPALSWFVIDSSPKVSSVLG